MTTFSTIEDLERILRENEDWRERIRRLLLTDELLTLPERHAEFVAEMRSFVAEMHSFVAEMRSFVAEMRAFVAETNRRLDNLETHAEITDQRLTNLEAHAERTNIQLDQLRGDSLEGKLNRVVPPLLARVFAVRRVFITWSARGYAQSYRSEPFDQHIEATVDAGEISDADDIRLRATDLVVRSQRTSDRSTVWFAVEASGVINLDDIKRSRHSADALQKAFSQDAEAIVYGYRIRDEDRQRATALGVHVFLHSD